jgi:hypothetical protein
MVAGVQPAERPRQIPDPGRGIRAGAADDFRIEAIKKKQPRLRSFLKRP